MECERNQRERTEKAAEPLRRGLLNITTDVAHVRLNIMVRDGRLSHLVHLFPLLGDIHLQDGLLGTRGNWNRPGSGDHGMPFVPFGVHSLAS